MDIITRIFNPQDIWLCPIKKVDTKAPITKALLSNSAETEIIIMKNKATLRSLDIRVIGFLKIVNYCTSSKGKWTYNKSNPSGRTSNKNNVIKKIKSMKFKEGDIFYIPYQNEKFGLGQIIKIPDKQSLSVIIYEELFEKIDYKFLEITLQRCKPLLFGNSFDAKYYHKDWVILGNIKSVL